jgi:hypothetical protein
MKIHRFDLYKSVNLPEKFKKILVVLKDEIDISSFSTTNILSMYQNIKSYHYIAKNLFLVVLKTL